MLSPHEQTTCVFNEEFHKSYLTFFCNVHADWWKDMPQQAARARHQEWVKENIFDLPNTVFLRVRARMNW